MAKRGPKPSHFCKRGHDKRVTGTYGGPVGGRGNACRQCSHEYGKLRRAERRKLVQTIKLERGCANCGYREHACALAFHHVDPTTKSFNIGTWATSSPLADLLAEIAKCIVLCANCHAVATHGDEEDG